MINSFYIGAVGLAAQQTGIDAIANNVANVSTYAYKAQRVTFEDLFYKPVPRSGDAGRAAEGELQGLGVAAARTDVVFTSGSLVQTGNALDIAVKGNGFFPVTLPDGTAAYARLGSFSLDSTGQIVTATGMPLSVRFAIPANASNIIISSTGAVTATLPNQSQPVTLGQLDLAGFVNPQGLQPLGSGLYAVTDSSGQAYLGQPGQDGLGTLQQGYLEASNVDLNQELTNLLVAQRSYAMSSKVVQVSDDILSTLISLRPAGA